MQISQSRTELLARTWKTKEDARDALQHYTLHAGFKVYPNSKEKDKRAVVVCHCHGKAVAKKSTRDHDVVPRMVCV
jgi:hypothetical protein